MNKISNNLKSAFNSNNNKQKNIEPNEVELWNETIRDMYYKLKVDIGILLYKRAIEAGIEYKKMILFINYMTIGRAM